MIMDRLDTYRTAVLSIDIEKVKDDIVGLADYRQALLVFRFRRAVVGQATCPVRQGRIAVQEIRSLMSGVSWPVWQEMVRPKPHRPFPSASIAVCTRDRTGDLTDCLQSLLPFTDQGYDVLVVDNCPSDQSTFELVGRYPQIRYIHEPTPGLDVARNRALVEARGDIVAFTDDDAVVDPGWLAALLDNFSDPTVAIVTGVTLPAELDTAAQRWFETTNGFGRGFVREVYEADTLLPLAAGRVGAGVNMAIRRSAAEEIGLFDVALDGGTLSRSGGDQEFFFRTLSRGFRIVYEPRALVWHKHRREWQALRNTLYGYGVGVFAWWTSALLHERETTLLWRAPRWFCQYHVRNLARALLHPGAFPLDLAWAEFCGAIAGPISYLRARRRARQIGRESPVEIIQRGGKQHQLSADTVGNLETIT
jgi:glycosyltransferase involved in cell wall biosynthesis